MTKQKQVAVSQWTHKILGEIAIYLYQVGAINRVTRKDAVDFLAAWYADTQGIGDKTEALAQLQELTGRFG